MRKLNNCILCLTVLFSLLTITPTFASTEDENTPGAFKQDWTVLVFLNGNNNLDPFGTMNLKQMEQIGSTKDVNIVVQWASLKNQKTKRLFITKDITHEEVTSKVVEDLGQVDMGDSKSLLDFIKWGTKKYPAKHYLIDVWNHGSGWHAYKTLSSQSKAMLHPTDISWDDNTGHSITTRQLADVLSQATKIIGHKIDLYGSDACLMGMVEIANEVANSVEIYAGSEEVEAAAGWPYHKILGRLVQHPEMTSENLGKVLTEEYVDFYNKDDTNKQNATFSAFNLGKITPLNLAITQLSADLLLVNTADRAKLIEAVQNAQRFTYDDYADLSDILAQLESTKISAIRPETLTQIKRALSDFVISYASTPSIPRSFGASIWFPTSISTYTSFSSLYGGLKFESQTHWGASLNYLLH